MANNFNKNMKQSWEDLKKLKIKNLFTKGNPIEIAFVLAIVFVIVGIVISFLKVLIWIGGTILLIFLLYLIIFLRENY